MVFRHPRPVTSVVLAWTTCTGTEPWGRTTFHVDQVNSFVTLPITR
jgi:hypothetical protein